jgi:hypothetical protein
MPDRDRGSGTGGTGAPQLRSVLRPCSPLKAGFASGRVRRRTRPAMGLTRPPLGVPAGPPPMTMAGAASFRRCDSCTGAPPLVVARVPEQPGRSALSGPADVASQRPRVGTTPGSAEGPEPRRRRGQQGTGDEQGRGGWDPPRRGSSPLGLAGRSEAPRLPLNRGGCGADSREAGIGPRKGS